MAMKARFPTRLFLVLVAVALCFSVESFAQSKKKTNAKAKPAVKTKAKPEKKVSPRDELLEMTPEDGGDILKEAPLPPPDAVYPAVPPPLHGKSGEGDPTYFYWQVHKGQFAITPYGEASYFKNKGTLITGAPGGTMYDVKGQKYRVAVELEYGVFKNISAGIGASYYAQYTDEDLSASNGFEDIPVFAKGFFSMSKFNWHYGIRMTFSPADKINDGFGNRNSFSGGNAYGPYLGFSRKLESGVAGISVSYIYKDTRSSFRDPTTGSPVTVKQNIEGGHILNIFGFYERKMGSWTLGGAAGYAGESEKTNKSSVSSSFEDGETNFVGKIYFPYQSSSMEIVPAIHAQTFLDDQLGNRLLDAKWQVTARCDVRF